MLFHTPHFSAAVHQAPADERKPVPAGMKIPLYYLAVSSVIRFGLAIIWKKAKFIY